MMLQDLPSHYLHIKNKTPVNQRLTRVSSDQTGARTQDPRLKRALLYQLSYGIICQNAGANIGAYF